MIAAAGYGIDVSHHQGRIDWKQVAKVGIMSAGNYPVSFAILKCIYESQSHGKDDQFEANYEGCIKNGIPIGVYVYHGSKSLANPIAEANALVRALNGRRLHLGIWHDLEDKSLQQAGNAAIKQMLETEDAIFRAAGYTDVGIYCNKYWYDRVLDTKYLKSIYKYWWIARYQKNDNGTIPGDSMSPHKYANAWQFSSKGRVAGISGYVDLDIDYTGLAAAMSGDSPKPIPGDTSSKIGIKTIKVTKSLNVRKSPGTGDNIIGTLPNGTRVNVTKIEGSWAKIEGYVSTKYLI